MYAAVGAMAMPLDFKYKNVLQRGRPKHNKYDDFYRKHRAGIYLSVRRKSSIRNCPLSKP